MDYPICVFCAVDSITFFLTHSKLWEKAFNTKPGNSLEPHGPVVVVAVAGCCCFPNRVKKLTKVACESTKQSLFFLGYHVV